MRMFFIPLRLKNMKLKTLTLQNTYSVVRVI